MVAPNRFRRGAVQPTAHMYSITLVLSPSDDLYHLSNVLSGLFELSRTGQARIRLSSASAIDYPRPVVVPVMKVLKDKGGPVCAMAIDLSDRSDEFAMAALERCDVYYKRSFFMPHLEEVPTPLRTRIRPFGMSYPCRTGSSTARVLAHLLPQYLKCASDLKYRELAHVLTNFWASPAIKKFEHLPSQPVDPLICFQTRLWKSEDVLPDSCEEVNAPRVELVRLLKKEFREAFCGGLVPNVYTLQRYPDAVANCSSRRGRYIARSRRTLIGVSTRGLHHSVPFKLPEYLASSKCIVSDPIRNLFPAPLLRDRNYFEFRTPDECVHLCARLLQDRTLAEQMRHANWAYYNEHVRCDRLLLRCFEDAFREGQYSENIDHRQTELVTELARDRPGSR